MCNASKWQFHNKFKTLLFWFWFPEKKKFSKMLPLLLIDWKIQMYIYFTIISTSFTWEAEYIIISNSEIYQHELMYLTNSTIYEPLIKWAATWANISLDMDTQQRLR